MTSPEEKRLISLVIPFYNEEDNVHNTLDVLARTLDLDSCNWEIIAVNDGSKDRTLEKLYDWAGDCFSLVVVELSRNFGKEAALTAGLNFATGHAVIPFDADLQDPPEVITRLIAEWQRGFDVVLAKRSDRSSDSFLKRATAKGFYKVINKFSDVTIPENAGDFRLMSRQVVDAVIEMTESRRFMKGLFAWAGYRTAVVEYVRPPRAAGSTKFSGWKLWNLALEGITAFSIAPLKIWSYVGFLVATLSFLYGGFIVLRTIVFGIDLPGYASLISVILFMSGLQMIGLGVLGEYVGRTYLEAKGRPIYLVRSVIRRSVDKASPT